MSDQQKHTDGFADSDANDSRPPGPMSLIAWLQLLALGVVWGASFFFARVAVIEIPPLTLVLFRVGIAAVALHIYLVVCRISFMPAIRRAGPYLVLATINNVIPFSLIFVGQTELGAGLAAILNATTPFWTVFVANWLTDDERISLAKIVGVSAGIAGTAVMIGPGFLADLGAPIWAKLAIVGAAISYAFAVIYAKRFKKVEPVVTATGQLTASTVIMLPLVFVIDGVAAISGISIPVWASVLALALVSTALAYILYFTLIANAGATNASLVTLVVPVSAILLGALFLGERLELYEFAGMVLITLGLIVIDGRLFARRRINSR